MRRSREEQVAYQRREAAEVKLADRERRLGTARHTIAAQQHRIGLPTAEVARLRGGGRRPPVLISLPPPEGDPRGDTPAAVWPVSAPRPSFEIAGRTYDRDITDVDWLPLRKGQTLPAKPSDFGTFGRFVETPVAQMPPEMKKAYDFTMQLRGLVPGPHKIWLANPKLSETIVRTGAYFQTQSTLTKAEIEIATNVINGRWLAAYSNYEHEWIAEDLGGLDAEKVQRLIAGLPTAFDDARQQVVYELASALAAPRLVPTGLFQRAQRLLGDAGIVDVTVLMGWFTAVSLTLMAYDVPSNAVGLDQQHASSESEDV